MSMPPLDTRLDRRAAVRTAFVSRFILLREGRRSNAHSLLQKMSWTEFTTAEHLALMFLEAFRSTGESMAIIHRQIGRALEHAYYLAETCNQYQQTKNPSSFNAALADYEISQNLLFGKSNEGLGWRLKSIKINQSEKQSAQLKRNRRVLNGTYYFSYRQPHNERKISNVL